MHTGISDTALTRTIRKLLHPVATRPLENTAFYLIFHDECIDLKQNNYIFGSEPVDAQSGTAKAMYGLRTLRTFYAVKWSDTFDIHDLYEDLS